MLFFAVLLNVIFTNPYSENIIIDGYTNRISAYPGDSIELYLNASINNPVYTAKLYDLNGQEVAKYTIPVFQQSPINDKAYETGFGYKLSKKILIPFLKSGVYLLENKIPLIIKSADPEIVILYSANTINAYGNAGGKSMYTFNSSHQKGTTKASFLRPLPLPKYSEAFLRWVNNQPFENVGYITDVDMEDYNYIKESKLLIIPGHSEYWTLQARKNFDRFVHEGKNALILSGNTMWMQVRYSENKDQLICYRNANEDPIKSSKLKTIIWNDVSLGYPITSSTGTDFRFAGYGLKTDKGWNGFKIISKSPLLEDTHLKPGDILSCPSDEMDGAPLAGFINGIPVLNYAELGFEKVEIVGYDMVSWAGVEGIGTWIVFKPKKSAGTVINTASTDWCSIRGIGTNTDIQKITGTMIRKLLNNENVFSAVEGKDL